jgi:hypothetical protein
MKQFAKALLANSFMQASALVYSSTMKMEATCSSETLADFQLRHYIPKERTLHNHRCENLKSYTILYRVFINFQTYRLGKRCGRQLSRRSFTETLL